MTEPFAITDTWAIFAILLVSAVIVYFGLVEVAFGAYASMMHWAYNVSLGPTVLLWVAVATLLGASASRHFHDPFMRRASARRLALNNSFVLWTAAWFGWMLIIYVAFPTDYAELLIKNNVLYGWLSLVVVLFFVDDMTKMRRMAYAFLGTSLLAGLVSIATLRISLAVALDDPFFQLRGLSRVNYLTFAITFAISVLYCIVLALTSRRPVEKALSVGLAAVSSVLLVLTGARQSMVSLLIAVLIFILWAALTRRVRIIEVLLISLISGAVALYLYRVTALAQRWAVAIDDLASRQEYWRHGWETFLESPLFGSGYDYGQGLGLAHNIFLDTLASQGLTGFVFFVGFVVFTLRSSRGSWQGTRDVTLSVWRPGLVCLWIYALLQSSVSGGLTGSPHFFWIAALIWKGGVLWQASEPQSSRGIEQRRRTLMPVARLARSRNPGK